MKVSKQTTAYNEIKHDLRTGDIILMHGIHLSSRIIEALENCIWSHAAIVVKAGDVGIELPDNDILLWESDTETPVNDVILGKPKQGPMLVKLSERLKYNFTHGEDSRCAVRHLYTDWDRKMFERFKQLIPKVHNAKFPDTYHEIVNPIKGRIFKKETDLSTMFCSELVAYTYMGLGLLTTIHPVNSYTPLDFSEDLSLSLLKRAWLGQEIELDINIASL